MFQLEQHHGDAVFVSGIRRLRLRFPTEATARVTYTEESVFAERESAIVITSEGVRFNTEEQQDFYRLSTNAIRVSISKASGALTVADSHGKVLLREPDRGGKWLTRKKVYRNLFSATRAIATGQSIDGARAAAESFETVFDREAFEAKLEFSFTEDEALFGLGSHEEGYGNLRGRSRELYQQNMKAVVPVLISSRGYGVLLDCESLMTFHDDALGSYWWADTVAELDYYIFCGSTLEALYGQYYALTGMPAMLPKWALGYVQSKERYVNAEELLNVASKYRRREIPLDCIVLDWKSWPNGSGWGQKSFDPVRFPDPSDMARALHNMDVRLMVSIWPIMTGGCENQVELQQKDQMLGNQSTYNAFDHEARATYWQQAKRGLFDHGVDAWWSDCTEPFEADWTGAVKPEPHTRLCINTDAAKKYIDEARINSFSLLHSRGIYDGQRSATEDRRVLNLTRSSYAGQHRYGTVTWNGDICGTWETLRRCIAEGVNFCATGEPFWTTDAGGFFIAHDPALWFWRGDYNDGCRGLTPMDALQPDAADTGCRDKGFWELYVRWMQYACFLPMMRSHGTDAAREIWRFGEPGEPFYDSLAAIIRLRSRLVPHLYSLMAAVCRTGAPMLRPLALEFPGDPIARQADDTFLLGNSLLIAPVTEPMYYGRSSQPLEGCRYARRVYLPASSDWFDLWTGIPHGGGMWVNADAPLETIPVFVRAGSILMLGPVRQFVGQFPDAPYAVHVYPGADGVFTLYEDAGDGYAYERGEYTLMHFRWDESQQQLTVLPREGSFPTMTASRELAIHIYADTGMKTETVRYDGAEVRIRCTER